MSTHEYLTGLRTSLTAYPHLSNAVTEHRDDAALHQITRLLGCGWTLAHLETLISRHARSGRSAEEALAVVHLYAHIGPADFDAWLEAHGGDLDALDDVETLRMVDVAQALRVTSLRLTTAPPLAG